MDERALGKERTAVATATSGPLAHTRGAEHAYRVLQAAYVAAPVIAGLDKFFDLLTDWDQYLAPQVALSPRGRHNFMRAVGVIEVAAGALVVARPRLGGWVVAGWLGGIMANLVAGRRSYDIVLRDLGLMLGAVALARLSASRHALGSLH